mgnify:FL=1
MPNDVSEIIAGTMVLLKKPKPTDLPIGDIYQLLCDRLEYYLNSLNMSDSNWILASVPISVTAGASFAVIPEGNFGRPVLVVTDGSNGEVFLRREVDIVNFQDLNIKHVEPILQFTSPSPFYKHNATKCAFFTNADLGQKEIHFNPPATSNCSYRIYYEPLNTNRPNLSDNTAFLGNFITLLKTDTALQALPLLVDSLSDRAYSAMEKRLSEEVMRLEAQFVVYASNNQQEQAGRITPFNENLVGYMS